VILGYLSVWIPLHSLYVQPRASVLLTGVAIVCAQLLTLSFVHFPLAQPNHSTALRTWLMICLAFCVVALVEFVLAIYHQRLRHALVRQWDQQHRKSQSGLVRGATIALRNRSQPLSSDSTQPNRPNPINGSNDFSRTTAANVPISANNAAPYTTTEIPMDEGQANVMDASISSRLFSKLLLLNQTESDEKEQFEGVWLDQLLKVLYPPSFVVIAIIYILVNI
jgi:hypothetical protein